MKKKNLRSFEQIFASLKQNINEGNTSSINQDLDELCEKFKKNKLSKIEEQNPEKATMILETICSLFKNQPDKLNVLVVNIYWLTTSSILKPQAF